MTADTSTPRSTGTATEFINNERARVTRWDFGPGEETGIHVHEMDYVVVPITSGTLLIIDDVENETKVELTAGVPYFRRADIKHNVINDNLAEISFVEIELL